MIFATVCYEMCPVHRERWNQVIAESRQALDEFLVFVGGIDEKAWNSPRSEGTWSPAETTEHLRLSYVTLLAEYAKKGGFRIRTTWWQRIVFRLLYLRRILRTGQFPRGVRAPKEIRPTGPYEKAATIDGLRSEAEKFLETMETVDLSQFKGLTHPYLGRMSPKDTVRFTTLHMRHHFAQIAPL